MDDLVKWLGQQLDKDERIAREAPHGPWQISNAVDPTQACEVRIFPDLRLIADGLNWLAAEHIASHNPARVLREIDAKRDLLTLHEPGETEYVDGDVCMVCEDTDVNDEGPFYPCKTLRVLALPYADQPGYREEWRP
ncbi:DUF6221 family protein [Streptomyces sp. NPDC004082]